MVDVVQLVEHRIVVPSVVGSSPIIHPKKSPHARTLFYRVDGAITNWTVTSWPCHCQS